jgi:hypothetical protein
MESLESVEIGMVCLAFGVCFCLVLFCYCVRKRGSIVDSVFVSSSRV